MGRDSKGAYNESGQYVKASSNGEYFSIYGSDPSKPDHERLTIKTNDDGTFSYSYHNGDKSEKSSGTGNCFLTSACIKYFQESFDDNCYELAVLRWFRDNFVSEEDIKSYYQDAPEIVAMIDCDKSADLIYDYIFDTIILDCVEAIENGEYDFAYERYKNSFLSLKKQFSRK